MDQHPAAEEFPELVDDEAGEATAIRLRVDDGEELGEMCAHDAVEHARRRRSRHVDGHHAMVRSGPGASHERAVFNPSDISPVTYRNDPLQDAAPAN